MKASTIREMRGDEVEAKLVDLKKQLFALRSQSMTEKVVNTKAMRNVKLDIARVKTIIRENEKKGQ